MERNLITSTQVAQRLGVDRRAVALWAKDGRLAYVLKLSGRTGAFLFDAQVIDALAKEKGDDDAQ